MHLLNESLLDHVPLSSSFLLSSEHLYRAPEVLRTGKTSQKADVYSFSIICQEILYRKGPFWIENSTMTLSEIVRKVRNGEPPLTRPTMPPSNDPLCLLVTKCWSELPSKRPDFNNIRWQLKRCLETEKTKGTSLLDNLLHRLGQYAQNLELLVEEKTADYLEQRRKAEEILYRLLPRPVADQLMLKAKVEAEKFEAVTLCFCDICGFTALSADSSPMEIVTMLNELYTQFDAVIDTFNVYKVETIGDAYLVVSGLARQPDHATEIALVSMSLVREARDFKIAHRPQQALQLRTGVHSGPVCAGVVGRKMPRYCLFGDTVNTTISIQNMAAPMTVLVSESTKELLNPQQFDVVKNGVLYLTGKGEVQTWVLQPHKHSSDYVIH